jgi:CDGSH-type Zn-finger protein/truncated hemoglobin YjbI
MSDIGIGIRSLLEAATELERTLGQAADDEQAWRISTRIRDSVLRPLRLAAGLPTAGNGSATDPTTEPSVGSARPAGAEPGSARQLSKRVPGLARAATGLRVQVRDVPELAEATAALQDLAVELAEAAEAAELLAEFEALQAGLAPQIQPAPNGPYLVTNTRTLDDWLGRPLPVRPQLALCRCGGSQIKPLCDGTHAKIGFTDAKDPGRVPDRRDTYVGQQVTILDNRGTCQHSGLCTDRLATVFHSGEEPFVTPSGGRMDEIIRAVRDCPSGALSYAMDEEEARAEVDHHTRRAPMIEVSKDGPYRITGAIPLIDQDGTDTARNQGASREHYALCRCGQSQNKPFCSGMHWYVSFRDPVPDSNHEPTLFEWAGGLPALTRMTRLFYEKHVPQDPLLAPLFATMSPDHPQRVAMWLGEVFGGPTRYSQEYGGYPRMLSQHVGKQLTEQRRARWVALLLRSAHEAGLPNDPEFRSAFAAYIEWGSRLAVENSQSGARPPQHMPMPHWDWHTAAGPPGSRISALDTPTQRDEATVDLPAADEPVRFADHIKPLFRQRDRQSMSFAFDLWSHDDVTQHADAILARLRAGTMPCDGAWPRAQIDMFQRWVAHGKPG